MLIQTLSLLALLLLLGVDAENHPGTSVRVCGLRLWVQGSGLSGLQMCFRISLFNVTLSVSMYVCAGTYVCISVCMYVCMNVCMHICICIYI